MKTQTTKQELKRGLAIVSDIARPSTMPILSNILLTKQGDKLQFLASDIDLQITAVLPAFDDGENFSITVPSAKFNKIVGSLSDDAKINLDIDEGKISVKSGRSKFGLQTLPAIDFPIMDISGDKSVIKTTQEALKTALQGVVHAMGDKDVREYLNGLLFDIKDNSLTLVATDGHRLATNSITVDADDVSQIVPRAAVIKLIKLLNDGPMTIEFYPNKVKFIIDEIEFVSKLIDSKFPDWLRVIPKNNNIEIKIQKQGFIDAVNRSMIVLDKFRGCRVAIEEKSISITCTNNGETSSDGVEIDYDGAAINAGFNPDYLKDCFGAYDGEYVILHLLDDKSPFLVTGDDGLSCVVMSMRM